MARRGDAEDSNEECFYKLEATVESLSKDVGSISLSIGKLESIMGLLIEEHGVPHETPEQCEEEVHKEKPSHSILIPPPFKVEAKIKIESYDGYVNGEKLDHCLAQLEVYFSLHQINESQKISFAWLK